jgi:hypothetical protein
MPRCAPRHAPGRVELDFVPIRRAPGAVGWILLAVGLACAVFEANRYLAARHDLDRQAAVVDALRTRQQAQPSRLPSAPPLSQQDVHGVQRVVARLEADWSGVFAALARVRGADVAWVEVEMMDARGVEARGVEARASDLRGRGDAGTAAGRGLRLGGEARSLDAVLGVLARMRLEPVLAGAELVSHEAVTDNGVALVRFVVSTRAQGAG